MLSPYTRRYFLSTIFLVAVPCIFSQEERSVELTLDRDTILVWETRQQDSVRDFVVRIARFAPDRYIEWEDHYSQGTVYMSDRDVLEGAGYTNSRLFQAGIDARADNETTLWLSRDIFRKLKENKKAKCKIDRVQGLLTYEGNCEAGVEVNRTYRSLPVIKARDNRGAEIWYLDFEDNPLMVRYALRHYVQTLVSITTDRSNTLRWIKGKKLLYPQ